MKIVDVTEFYSERGGGVRSHLTLKGHVLCQLGHEHVVVAPGPEDRDESIEASTQNGHANGDLPEKMGPLLAHSASRARFTGDSEAGLATDLSRAPHGANAAVERGRARVVRIGGPSLPYDPTYHLLWRIDKIRQVVKRERPDVLEIHSPYVAAASALACDRDWFGIRTFCWHSDFIDTYLRVMLEERLEPLIRPAARWMNAPAFASRSADVALEPLWAMVRTIGRSCDATFVAARWQKEKLASHGMPRLVHVPFGIEASAFTPSAASAALRRELLGEHHANPHAHLLLGVGRFAVEKRWDVVLDAFTMLRETQDAVLALFGDGPERDAMRARVGDRDDVKLMGFERDRARLASALASADALVHGCPYETFGLSIAEAMSAGLPVVVPDRGGAAELAHGPSAEVYASLDPRACRDAIVRLLARDREALRAAAVAEAARVPNVREQFAALCGEYARLLSANGEA